MSEVRLKVEEVDQFFIELQSRCRQKNGYSLLDIIQKMGASPEEVSNWVKSNEQWSYTLQLCVELCCMHVKDAELIGDISEELALHYLQQNGEFGTNQQKMN